MNFSVTGSVSGTARWRIDASSREILGSERSIATASDDEIAMSSAIEAILSAHRLASAERD
ncbi:MAG TPA: hypothetical protein VF516_04990 [Kofleriaceae bacterium]